jgi:hypothetical protein
VGHILHSVSSGMQNVNALFFMLGCDWYGFCKKCAGARYAKLGFLHPVGSAGHVVHSLSPGHKTLTCYFSCLGGTGMDYTKNMLIHVTLNLCFWIQWDLWVT